MHVDSYVFVYIVLIVGLFRDDMGQKIDILYRLLDVFTLQEVCQFFPKKGEKYIPVDNFSIFDKIFFDSQEIAFYFSILLKLLNNSFLHQKWAN